MNFRMIRRHDRSFNSFNQRNLESKHADLESDRKANPSDRISEANDRSLEERDRRDLSLHPQVAYPVITCSNWSGLLTCFDAFKISNPTKFPAAS
jgi:hypothetical protein